MYLTLTVRVAGPIDATIGDKEIDTNLRSVIVATATVLPHLKAQPSAYLINVSSDLCPSAALMHGCQERDVYRHANPVMSRDESVSWCLLLDQLSCGPRNIPLPPPAVMLKLGAGEGALQFLPF